MKNLKISAKLLVTFACVFVVTVTLAVFSILGLSKVANQFTTFYEGPYIVTTETMNMRRVIAGAERSLLLSCSATDINAVNDAIDQANGFLDDLDNGIVVLKEKSTGDKALLDDLSTFMASTVSVKERIFSLSAAHQNDQAFKLYTSEYLPMMNEARAQLENIGTVADTNATNFYHSALSTERSILALIITLTVISLLLIVLFSTYLTRLLTRPIKEIGNVATEMAMGHLNVSLSYQSKDEFGVLANNMRDLTTNLRGIISDQSHLLGEVAVGNLNVRSRDPSIYIGDFEVLLLSIRKIVTDLSNTISQINQASSQVSSGGDQVSSGAQALSQGATEQASSVEELAATINEISIQVKNTAANAENANATTAVTAQEVTVCNKQMQDLITAMADISKKSNDIGRIIKTIEDIAFQTNILALNAAVEAARAGAVGKGFAVVADEVRNLASKSAEASKNTSALIEGSIESVKRGTALAGETAETLLRVVTGAEQVGAAIVEISSATTMQATSIAQVTQGIEQISSVVQTNSATAEESAAASEELSGQAQMLHDLVDQFILRTDAVAPTREQNAPREHKSAPHAVHAGHSDKY